VLAVLESCARVLKASRLEITVAAYDTFPRSGREDRGVYSRYSRHTFRAYAIERKVYP